jgi:hypothetical protein
MTIKYTSVGRDFVNCRRCHRPIEYDPMAKPKIKPPENPVCPKCYKEMMAEQKHKKAA